MTPRVSVVVPTHQRALLLREPVVQLLARTLTDFEIIEVGDGSTGDTPTVMSSFDDPRVHYLRRDHLGMPGILNVKPSLALVQEAKHSGRPWLRLALTAAKTFARRSYRAVR